LFWKNTFVCFGSNVHPKPLDIQLEIVKVKKEDVFSGCFLGLGPTDHIIMHHFSNINFTISTMSIVQPKKNVSFPTVS